MFPLISQASKDIDVMLFFFYLFEKRLQRGHARRGWKAVEVFKYLNCGEASGVAGRSGSYVDT